MTPLEFREHFPALRDLTHLCSCSQGALSREVEHALGEHLRSWSEEGAPWRTWMSVVDDARQGFAALIGADPDEVAVVSNASEGAYHVAASLDYTTRPRIVTNDLEFPSVSHVWLAQQPRGAEVTYVPEREGALSADDYVQAMDPATALVSVPLATYANGYRPPVRSLTSAAHDQGARVFVDAYQAVGVLPVDVRELDCDFLVAGALKYLLGVPGIAFLYVRGELIERLESPLTGWFARRGPYDFTPRVLDYAPSARRFQTGTPAIPAAYAARAGVSLLRELEPKAVWCHVDELAQSLQDSLLDEGFALYSPLDREARGPQVAVRLDDPEEAAAFLKARGIVASPRGPALRLSLHYYNTHEDVDTALAALRAYRDSHPDPNPDPHPDWGRDHGPKEG